MTGPGIAAGLPALTHRHAWTIAGILIAIHLTLAWLARAPGIFGDQAVYLSLARSLRDAHYRELFRIDLPVHRMYPPGYPLMLALWSAIGGEQLNWLVLLALGCSAGALLLFFSAVRAVWGSAVALATLLALTFNPALIERTGWLLSEPPFMLFHSLSIWALVPRRDSVRAAVIAGAAAIGAALIRSVGVTLVIALAVYWLWQRQYRRALLFTAIATLTVGGWLLFTAAAPEQVLGSSYMFDAVLRPPGVSLFDAIVERASRNAAYVHYLYWNLPAPGIPATSVDNVIGMPIVVTAVLAGLWIMATVWAAPAVYVASYAALLMTWPWAVGRFLTPLLPWLVLAAVLSVERLATVFKLNWRTPVLLVAAVWLAVAGLQGTTLVVRQRLRCDRTAASPSAECLPQSWADFFAGLDHVRARVPADGVLISGAPATVYLSTGQLGVSLPRALGQPPSEFLDFLRTRRAEYILLSDVVPFAHGSPPVNGTPLGAMVRANCEHLQLEASFASAHLFRIAPPGQTVEGRAACEAADHFVAWSRRKRSEDADAGALTSSQRFR